MIISKIEIYCLKHLNHNTQCCVCLYIVQVYVKYLAYPPDPLVEQVVKYTGKTRKLKTVNDCVVKLNNLVARDRTVYWIVRNNLSIDSFLFDITVINILFSYCIAQTLT